MARTKSRSKLLTEVLNEEHGQSYDAVTQINEEEKNNDNLGVGHEIECPRCHDIMTLQSEFDRLGDVCQECDFLLYFN
jgi:hypothetical protein